MPEYILIAGKPVEVPGEEIAAGTASAWHRTQLEEKKIPHVVFENGDPVELPAAVAGKSKKEIEAWKDDEAERRIDPVAHAERKLEAERVEQLKKAQLQKAASSVAPATPASADNTSKE